MYHLANQKGTIKENELTGRYQASGRGFGFVIPQSGEADYFIPPHSGGGAWNGDLVSIRPEVEAEAQGERNVAAVTQVLERANRIVIGALERQGKELWLTPDSDRLPHRIQVIGKARGARAGERAAVAMQSFGCRNHVPLGTLQATFGPATSRAAAVDAILYHYDIEKEFPPAVLMAAEEVPQEVPEDALRGRLDLRAARIITIDGASAKDLDDAVSLEKDDAGHWTLGVHIADVSHYVSAGSVLDEEAFTRGTSVYYADQVVPMLPVALSNGICSLHPNVTRLCLSCIMTLGMDGNLLGYRIEKTVICTTERMTYDDCNTLLSGGDGVLEARYEGILPMLRDMAALASVLENRRRVRGSLDLESGESYIVCDADGKPQCVEKRAQGVSEALIESFMLCANECVAKHLCDNKNPAVYRIHEKPSLEKTENLRAMLAPLGYDLKEADSYGLQKVLRTAKGTPEELMISTMVLRSLMKARYDVQNLGHFGLAAEFYCHFTSPIRRYPDLMVHRILSAQIAGKLRGAELKRLTAAAARAAAQSSARELAAQNAEREIEKRYMAEYMGGHLEEVFPAAVSGASKLGLFVTLQNGIEGFLPAINLPDDHYQYDEVRLSLTGTRGQTYSIGTLLEVMCIAADQASGEITFTLPGGAAVTPRAQTAEKKAAQRGGQKTGNRRSRRRGRR